MSYCQLCAQESGRVTDDIRRSSGFARDAQSSAVNGAEKIFSKFLTHVL